MTGLINKKMTYAFFAMIATTPCAQGMKRKRNETQAPQKIRTTDIRNFFKQLELPFQEIDSSCTKCVCFIQNKDGSDIVRTDMLKQAILDRTARYKKNPNLKMEYSGKTFLHAAAIAGNLDLIKFLIEEMNYNVNQKDYLETTALSYAVMKTHANCVNFLIKKGADVNIPSDAIADCFTNTVRCHNTFENLHSTIKDLMDNGANTLSSRHKDYFYSYNSMVDLFKKKENCN